MHLLYIMFSKEPLSPTQTRMSFKSGWIGMLSALVKATFYLGGHFLCSAFKEKNMS